MKPKEWSATITEDSARSRYPWVWCVREDGVIQGTGNAATEAEAMATVRGWMQWRLDPKPLLNHDATMEYLRGLAKAPRE